MALFRAVSCFKISELCMRLDGAIKLIDFQFRQIGQFIFRVLIATEITLQSKVNKIIEVNQIPMKNRNEVISKMRSELGKMPIISKNSLKVQKTLAKQHSPSEPSSNTKASLEATEFTGSDLHKIKKASLFDEKYTMGEKIGEGANGFVNKCIKNRTETVYAVKSLMIDEEHIMELKSMFLSMKQLSNPNVVKYEALYIDMRKKLCYLVMEYVEWPSLSSVHIDSEDELRHLVFELLSTLKYLHEKNISHRDIKPENIMYHKETKRIKIIDFGTAKKYVRRQKRCQMLTITGTLYYRAPEMFAGGGYDQKVDIWSTAVLIYKLIAGRTPFESSYLSDTIQNIQEKALHFAEPVWGGKYSLLKKLLERMMRKNPVQRLSAEECLRDIWFYDIEFLKNTNLTKSQQYIMDLEIYQKRKRSDLLGEVRVIRQPVKSCKDLFAVNSVVKKVEGEEYHLIDSDGEEETESLITEGLKKKNSRTEAKRMLKSKLFNSNFL